MDFNTGNERFPSSSKEQTYFTPYKHPSKFKGNIAIESMKQLTAKIRKDIEEFTGILKDVHEKSRTTRRIGVGIAVAGLERLHGYLEDATRRDQDYSAEREFNTSNSDSRYRFFEDATHRNQDYRAERRFNTSYLDIIYRYLLDVTHLNTLLPTSSLNLFKILDLIKLSLTLDRNSESASSQPLCKLTDFLDIFKAVVDNLPNYCDCSRYKFRLPLTYEDLIQMYESAIRLAEMCKSEARAAEMYRTKKREAELQMYEDQVAKQRLNDTKVEIQRMGKIYEEEILNLNDNMIAMHEMHEAEILKMYKQRIAPKIGIRRKKEEREYGKHHCPVCKAFNCKCIEVCARCHRPLK